MEGESVRLKVWWIPQVPMQPFEFSVSTPEEGARFMDVLALYDAFQFEHNIKPDYSNVGGLSMFEDGEWTDWCDADTGDDLRQYMDRKYSSAPSVELPDPPP